MKQRAAIPIGHGVDYCQVSMDVVKAACTGTRLKPDIDEVKFLEELQFTISVYAAEKQADKTRALEIMNSLKGEMSSHSSAANVWLRNHGGKEQDAHRARIKLKETVAQGRLKGNAKTLLVHSLARILGKYTIEPINTSRDNGNALTKDGALATLFHAALKVHGETINDPFPYLKSAVASV